MGKGRVKILIISMSLALIGLLLLQFYWIRNAHQATKDRFEENVRKTLYATVADLEKAEAFKGMDPNTYYESIVMSEFGEVMQFQEAIQVRDTVIIKDGESFRFLVVTGTTIDTATGLKTEQRVIQKDLSGISEADFANDVVGVMDSNQLAIQLNASFERQIMKKARYLNQLMSHMFSSNFFDDINFRLNVHRLDSILTKNLQKHSLDTVFRFNVVDMTNDEPVLFSELAAHQDPELVVSNYHTTLYPNDEIPAHYKLLISFPDQSSFLWKDMIGTLLGSIFLVLIVVFAFYFAVSTIFKQKQLSEIKNDFISNMTHELKTPISTISLACEAVRDPDVSKDIETINSFIGMIDQENKRLAKLVENVLQTALIDKGKLKLQLESAEINKLVKEVVEAFQIRFKNKGGEIKIERLDDVVHNVDRIHFTNVLYNLLDNSLKYCNQNPEVEIRLVRMGQGFSLEVKDNGIGIKKEDQKKIFEKLFRVPTGDVHDVKGFGLGLSYVYSIVKLHNGEIDLVSSPGKGSTFKINLS